MADFKPVILIVDDELSIRESFSLILGKEFRVMTAASGEAALKHLIDEKVDLVYLDIRMPGLNGIETLKRIKEIDPATEVIMVTAVNEVGSATAAIKLGAKDYVVKPFDVKDIQNKTRSIIIKAGSKTIRPWVKDEFIGSSKHSLNIRRAVEQAARKDSSVLIVAEKGLEGEEMAGIISSETGKPLHIIEVSSDSKSSGIFGCESGSFTEAFIKDAGILEEAEGGILFIRNIEHLSLPLQERLAKAIESGKFTRDGSTSPITLDTRIIAETSVDLKGLVKEGLFNGKLLALISGTVIELPPLRQRGDVPELIKHCLNKFNSRYNRMLRLSRAAENILSDYPWPGNITELSNTMEILALTVTHDEVVPEDLPMDILLRSSADAEHYLTLEHFEEILEGPHILDIYKKAGESIDIASKMLGILPKTLRSKLGSPQP